MSSATIPPFPLSWRTVSLGTKCLSAGALTLFVGLVLLPLAVALQFYLLGERYAAQELRGRGIPDATVLAALFILAAGLMLWLAGLCLCALAPAESGARPFALAAAACCILGVLAALQTSLLPVIGFTPVSSRVVIEQRNPTAVTTVNEIAFGASAGILAFAGGILMTCFLGAVATHFRNVGVLRQVHRLLIGQLAGMALLVLIGFGYLYTAAAWRDAGPWLVAPFLAAALIGLGLGCRALLSVLAALRSMLAIAEENAQALETAPASE
jgi:hypothetical protein